MSVLWRCSSAVRIARTREAAGLLDGLGTGAPVVDDGGTRVRLPVGTEGSRALVEAVRRFDGAGLHVDELAMHRPTLDDVFLTLTGHGAEREQAEEAPAAAGRRGRRGR